ncbi:MAG TPA: class I SAM-dependent methyltransferase [Vicinamibacterales bacterium]|nr:class I SAM-dependent methyltransferase [Vicinamibacterales bacterium]
MSEGWQGWDAYAPFYDWENARTVARRDLPFWESLAARQPGLALELGCGTGRVALPLLKAGVPLVGIDRSEAMLARARRKARRAGLRSRARFVRGDIRRLPFRKRPFGLVLAPYGMLQSLTRECDLAETLGAVATVLRRDGVFGIDLVPDLPRWSEYTRRVTLSGSRDARTHLTLRESVRQDTRRRLTMFDQEYVERRGSQKRLHRFALTFRTLSVPQMRTRLERAGFRVRAVLGDYQGGPWHPDADVWIILASRA